MGGAVLGDFSAQRAHTGSRPAAGAPATGRAVPAGASRPRGDAPAKGTAVPRGSVPGGGGGGYYPGYPGYYPPNYYGGYYPYYPYWGYGWGWGWGFGLSWYYDPFWFSGYWGYPGYDYGGYGGYGYYAGAGQVYYSGNVKLKIKPKGAEVFVDGYYVGIVDDFDGMFQDLQLSADPNGRATHKIEVRAPGAQPLTFEVRLLPGQSIAYRGELVTTSAPKR
jgi:hypothetical protein